MSSTIHDYTTKNVVQLLSRRQLGLPLKENGRAVRHKFNNYRCDFELLKTLLCDKHVHLEVIACRKVSRQEQPSFCHNRLFTNRYRTWFNLCTSPTAGPSLLKSDIFASGGLSPLPSNRIKVLNAVSLDPPNGCVPLPNSQHLPCILLLTKDQWLLQYSLEDASFLGQVYLGTSWFADELSESNDLDYYPKRSQYERDCKTIVFNYVELAINGNEGRVLVQSAAKTLERKTYIAYAVLALFPLRFINHFVTKTHGGIFKAELWNDFFVLTSRPGPTVSLYALKDIETLYHMDSSHIHLGKNLFCSDGLVEIGRQPVGLPYTLTVIDLDRWKDWSAFQLFKTKAPRHIFRVGGVPYHYAIPTDKNVTSWSLRSLVDCKEISKFHVDEKYDNSHIDGFDFHSDDSGRILLVNKDTVTVYKIEQVHIKRPKACSVTSYAGSSSNLASCNTASNACKPVKIISSSVITEPNFQLRVVGSVHSLCPSKRSPSSKHKVIECFQIKVDHKYDSTISESRIANNDEGVDVVDWQYPSEARQVGRSSYGRTLRRTQHYTSAKPEFGVQSVSYENELEILAILHLRADSRMCYGVGEPHYDLVVSLYDNMTGAKINTVVVERDLPPGEICETDIIMDEDTLIYTKSETQALTQDFINYKIMRFCRKY